MKKLFWMCLLLGAAATSRADYSTNVTVGTPIPDGNVLGLSSTVTISGVPFGGDNFITNVTLSLNVTGGFNGDYYAYLSHGGTLAVLLNRVGMGSANMTGYSDAGFANVTLNDQAAFDVHTYQANGGGNPLTGTWQSDGRNISPTSPPAAFDTAPRNAGLSLLDSSNPNGTWTFFIADVSSGNQGTLNSFTLDIQTTTPEPGAGAMIAFAGAALLFARQLSRRGTVA